MPIVYQVICRQVFDPALPITLPTIIIASVCESERSTRSLSAVLQGQNFVYVAMRVCVCLSVFCFNADMNVYKWKNHFVEMKGDVGMSVHEKGGKQVNATPTHKTIYNPIPTSL